MTVLTDVRPVTIQKCLKAQMRVRLEGIFSEIKKFNLFTCSFFLQAQVDMAQVDVFSQMADDREVCVVKGQGVWAAPH